MSTVATRVYIFFRGGGGLQSIIAAFVYFEARRQGMVDQDGLNKQETPPKNSTRGGVLGQLR